MVSIPGHLVRVTAREEGGEGVLLVSLEKADVCIGSAGEVASYLRQAISRPQGCKKQISNE